MKILIIGNGFDVAHGLPTKYTDFLDGTREFLAYHEGGLLHTPFVGSFADALNQKGMYDEFCMIKDNAWLNYLLNRYDEKKLQSDNWIDFENEIKSVVSEYEKEFLSMSIKTLLEDRPNLFVEKFWKQPAMQRPNTSFNFDYDLYKKIWVEFSEFLFSQLRDFKRAFEIYCLCIIDKKTRDYAEKSEAKSLANEINELQEVISTLSTENTRSLVASRREEILRSLEDARVRMGKLVEQYDALSVLSAEFAFNCDCVLSFNYTNTFETLYGNEKAQFCYIHGKAQDNPVKTNMVMGINETLNKDTEDEFFLFARFKKYFQRVVNKTGSQYKDWIKYMANPQSRENHEVYILGHSLGKTDHEVLREFFELSKNTDRVRITVFYYDDKLSKVRSVERIIEMIGKDDLINGVHGGDCTIKFVNQYESGIMKPHANRLTKLN